VGNVATPESENPPVLRVSGCARCGRDVDASAAASFTWKLVPNDATVIHYLLCGQCMGERDRAEFIGVFDLQVYKRLGAIAEECLRQWRAAGLAPPGRA
jgi:hypothetical protein